MAAQNKGKRANAPHRELQLIEDMAFQRREWTMQRLGWAVMSLLVLAAAAGLFGGGPLSSSSAESDGLRLEYERFARLDQPTTLRFHFSADGRDSATVSISRKYLDGVEIEHIMPQPVRVESDRDWLIYSFTARVGAASFHLKPEKIGTLAGEAKLGQGKPISFDQLIYP